MEDGVGPFDRMVGSVLIRPALDQGEFGLEMCLLSVWVLWFLRIE